jgi:hypothetical protein
VIAPHAFRDRLRDRARTAVGLLLCAIVSLSPVAGRAGGGRLAALRPAPLAPTHPAGAEFPTALAAAVQPTLAERQLAADTADGRIDGGDLLEAVLVAAGTCDPATLAACRSRWEKLLAEARSADLAADDPRRAASHLLEWLHRRVLVGGYDACCSDVAATLLSGRFNCVTSAVLYHLLAGEIGLSTQFIERRGHVACIVLGPGEPLVVETTCATWLSDRTGAATPAADTVAEAADAAAADSNAGERIVGQAGIVAIVFFNRGVDALEAQELPAAIGANWLALQCDPANASAWVNLLAAVNQWALAEAEAGHRRRAEELLAAGLQMAPLHAPFQRNLAAIRSSAVPPGRP